MTPTLHEPRILRCDVAAAFEHRVSVLCLDWHGAAPLPSPQWQLPRGLTFSGPPPERFSVLVQRRGEDQYEVGLVWNDTHLAWNDLTRQQLLESCLDELLAALGTDLGELLDQPVELERSASRARLN